MLLGRFPWPSILPYRVLVVVCKMDEHSALLSTCCSIGGKKFANMAVSTKYNVKDYARSFKMCTRSTFLRMTLRSTLHTFVMYANVCWIVV